MAKLDITKNKLFISQYIDSRSGVLPGKFIPFQAPRSSDAFVFILSGSCRYTFDDGVEFEAQKDGILYLAKGALYQMDINCEKYEFFVVNFNFSSDEERQSAFYTPLSPASAQRCFSRLYFNRASASPQDFARNMSLLYTIVEIVNESAERTYINRGILKKIEKSADRIHEEFASDLSVAALAKEAEMSEVYFRKLFSLRFGMPPSHYIMQTRVSHAVKLMSLEKLSLEDIAEKSGFSALPYFSKVFKSIMGETPAKYRRSLPKLTEIT